MHPGFLLGYIQECVVLIYSMSRRRISWCPQPALVDYLYMLRTLFCCLMCYIFWLSSTIPLWILSKVVLYLTIVNNFIYHLVVSLSQNTFSCYKASLLWVMDHFWASGHFIHYRYTGLSYLPPSSPPMWQRKCVGSALWTNHSFWIVSDLRIFCWFFLTLNLLRCCNKDILCSRF